MVSLNDIFNLPNNLIDIAGLIYRFILGIPDMIISLIISIVTILLMPFIAFVDIVVYDLNLLIAPVGDIVADVGNIVSGITDLSGNLINGFGQTAWATLMMAALAFLLALKIYNIMADVEIFGWKFPRIGK